jgi:hypothetical protein
MCHRVHDVVICINTAAVYQSDMRFCTVLAVTFCNDCGESAETHKCVGA